jgi:hypothetical protein
MQGAVKLRLFWSTAIALYLFAVPVFAANQKQYHYDTFACRYFNVVLVPFGKCVSEIAQENNVPLLPSSAAIIPPDGELKETVIVREIATSTVIIEREPTVTYVTRNVDRATIEKLVSDIVASQQLSTTGYVDSAFSVVFDRLVQSSTLFSRQRDSDRVGDVRDDLRDEIDALQAGEESFTTLVTTGSATIGGGIILSDGTSNIALGRNYISGDGDDEGIYIDSAGRIGIGTTTPSESLSIAGGALYLENYLPAITSNRLYAQGSSLYWNGGLLGGAASSSWDGNGTDVYRLSGNVGIGTTSPASALSVVGDITVTGSLRVSGNSGGNGQVLQSTGTGLVWVSTSSFASTNADTVDGFDSTYFLNRANHSGTQLAATIADFGTTTRGLFSSTALGLTYAASSGIFSLTAGYSIPFTASTTDVYNFFTSPSSRITAGANIDWTGSTLDVVTVGDWVGTFDGQEGPYYLDRSNQTGTQSTSTVVGIFGIGQGVTLYACRQQLRLGRHGAVPCVS